MEKNLHFQIKKISCYRRTNRRTDGRTDRPSCREARRHLKNTLTFLSPGIKRWMEDISFMFGFHPGRAWQYLWMVATPLFVFVMFIMTIANYEALTYNRTYHYPLWGITIGWVFDCLFNWACVDNIHHRAAKRSDCNSRPEMGGGGATTRVFFLRDTGATKVF